MLYLLINRFDSYMVEVFFSSVWQRIEFFFTRVSFCGCDSSNARWIMITTVKTNVEVAERAEVVEAKKVERMMKVKREARVNVFSLLVES